MTKLAQVLGQKKLSYRRLAGEVKEQYPDSKISKSTLQEMALGLKRVLPQQAEMLATVLGITVGELM